jgi:hypothetical protein
MFQAHQHSLGKHVRSFRAQQYVGEVIQSASERFAAENTADFPNRELAVGQHGSQCLMKWIVIGQRTFVLAIVLGPLAFGRHKNNSECDAAAQQDDNGTCNGNLFHVFLKQELLKRDLTPMWCIAAPDKAFGVVVQQRDDYQWCHEPSIGS